MANERRGCACAGVGCGCAIGFFLGAVIAVGGAWAWWFAFTEAVRQPLANLEIDDGPLTLQEKQVQIDKLADKFLASTDNVGLVVGILEDGQQHVFGYGSLSRGTQQVPDGGTVFEIASVGKTFTATLLADMHLKGELSWDDPLQKFLPREVNVPKQGQPITLIDLATHTSGLPSLPGGITDKATDPLNPYA